MGNRTSFSEEVVFKGLNEMREQASGVLELACAGSREPVAPISSQPLVQWCLIGSLKLARVGVLTPWKLANATNLSFFSRELIIKHLPAHHLERPCEKLWEGVPVIPRRGNVFGRFEKHHGRQRGWDRVSEGERERRQSQRRP